MWPFCYMTSLPRFLSTLRRGGSSTLYYPSINYIDTLPNGSGALNCSCLLAAIITDTDNDVVDTRKATVRPTYLKITQHTFSPPAVVPVLLGGRRRITAEDIQAIHKPPKL